MLDSAVLLLNHNFEPLALCSVRRAIVLVWSGKAEVIRQSRQSIRTVSRRYAVPEVIRLLMFVKISRGFNIPLTRRNIMRRDGQVCQYCGRSEANMTIDHIIPRSQGGRDTWENMVCACSLCNSRKGNRPPERAGMRLLRTPRKPNVMSILFAAKEPLAEAWRTYLNLF